MRKPLLVSFGIFMLSSTAMSAHANQASLLAAAEQSAVEAERAAAEAERAMLAARHAAQAARDAVNVARAAATSQLSPEPPAAPTTQENAGRQAVVFTSNSETAAAPSPGTSERMVDTLATSIANGPNSSALKSSTLPDFQLLAATKDKIASLSWSLDISGTPADDNELVAKQLTLSASGRLDDSGDASILGLDGFANGTEIKLSYTRYSSSRGLVTQESEANIRQAERNCRAVAMKESQCVAEHYDTGLSDFVAKYYPQGLSRLMKDVLPGPVWFLGASFSGNQANYKFLDRTRFKIGKEDHFGIGAGMFGGALIGAGQTAIIGSLDYRRTYNEQPSVTLCQPLTGTLQTQCITSSDGAPGRDSEAVLGLELRHAFPVEIGSFPKLAISPKFSMDIENDAYSVSLPIYFAQEASGKLRGGVRGVYTSQKVTTGGREGDFVLGLFVGVPFSLYKN